MRAVTDAPREVTDDLENRLGCGNAHNAAAPSETISNVPAHAGDGAGTTMGRRSPVEVREFRKWRKKRGWAKSRYRRDDDEGTANGGDKGSSPAGRGYV